MDAFVDTFAAELPNRYLPEFSEEHSSCKVTSSASRPRCSRKQL
jgi:hypothetical protein